MISKNIHVAKKWFALCLSSALLFSSCLTQKKAEQRLVPPKSVTEFRLDDISKHVKEDPAKAIHLIEVYQIIYGPGSVYPDGADPVVKEKLNAFRLEAAENLKAAQILATEEKRWTDAASYARSLAKLGIDVENTGEEPDLVLEYAKEQLSLGNNLSAFLAAVQSHALKPLSFDDAFLFLERAAEVKQRRTAAYFLGIIDRLALGARVSDELRSYAHGRDSVADMVNGVATVLVDRGTRIQRGMGIPDRVGGTAFFIDLSGLLITNYHVIASEVDPKYQGYSRMYIRMGDSASPRIPARVIGWDKTMDLALIKTEVTPEYVYSVVDWVVPRVGDSIFAIGSPGGLERTVTQGIVSTLGRRGFLQLGDVIQMDASVNPGNSGGPVLDRDGRLVGVTFAGIERFQGLNFAIPAGRLSAALPAMIAGGKADRPWLGFSLNETAAGAEIIYISPSTPAAEQQIREGSVIKSINGERIRAPQGALIPALQDRLFPLRTGELVSLELIEPGGNEVTHLIRLESRPDIPLADAVKMDTRERITGPLFGLVLSTREGSSYFSTFLVKKVVRGSIADEAGISESDPVSIRSFRVFEKDGYALLHIDVKKRRLGYMETSMQLPALLDTPDTL